MSDAAQGEPIQHEVFTSPFKVAPKFESWKTPGNYRRYPDGDKLPDQIKVWRIQDSGKDFGSVVSFSYGFEDSPDAEVLAAGFNRGKESGAVGVGRHGNFLQWGFSQGPSNMTDAGRSFFLNCVCYIRKFDGKAPLVRKQKSPRLQAVMLASLATDARNMEFLSRAFPAEVLQKHQNDPAALAAYYRQNLELVYNDKVFLVDGELQSLGLSSNRKIETLEKLVALLEDEEHAAVASTLLKRYTVEDFKTPAEWQDWLRTNRGRIYFTDVGGYKFRVAPEGYLLPAKAAASSAPSR